MSETKNPILPSHYGGGNNPYEAIKVITAWNLNFNLGNAVKYISRAGKKDKRKHLEDLMKAAQYIKFEIERLLPPNKEENVVDNSYKSTNEQIREYQSIKHN